MRIRSLVVVTMLAGLGGCGGAASGDRDSCATSLSGTFEGDAEGLIAARLTFDGELTSHWVRGSDGETFDDFAGTASESGELDVDGLEGAIDYESCVATGTWTRGEASGSFTFLDPTL